MKTTGAGVPAACTPAPAPSEPLLITRRARGRTVPRIAAPLFPATVSPQAVAAHKRSRAARHRRHVKRWGMFSEVVDSPPTPTFDEHRTRQHEAFVARWKENRHQWAHEWILARRRLRSLEPARAAELLAEWNARTDARDGPGDLLQFLTHREPTAELIEHRRQARLRSSAAHIESARRRRTWYIAHLACTEAAPGAVEIAAAGFKGIRCLACDRTWRTRGQVGAAEASNELAIVDFRPAEQLELL